MGIRLVRFPKGQVYSSGVSSETTSNIITINQDHDFQFGDIVYCDTDGIFKKALAEDSKRIEVIGMVSSIKSPTVFDICIAGRLVTEEFSTFGNGEVLYLSETSPGNVIKEPEMYKKPIAIKISDGIIVNIQRADILGHTSGKPGGKGYYYTKKQVDDLILDLNTRLDDLTKGMGNDGGYMLYNFYTKEQMDSLFVKRTDIDLTEYTDEQIKEIVRSGIKNTAPVLSDVHDYISLINKISNTEVYPESDEGVKDKTSINKVINAIDNVDIETLSAEDAAVAAEVSSVKDTIAMIDALIEGINNGNIS